MYFNKEEKKGNLYGTSMGSYCSSDFFWDSGGNCRAVFHCQFSTDHFGRFGVCSVGWLVLSLANERSVKVITKKLAIFVLILLGVIACLAGSLYLY